MNSHGKCALTTKNTNKNVRIAAFGIKSAKFYNKIYSYMHNIWERMRRLSSNKNTPMMARFMEKEVSRGS
jgi:hypothetical protein